MSYVQVSQLAARSSQVRKKYKLEFRAVQFLRIGINRSLDKYDRNFNTAPGVGSSFK
jgi:hypothetical protein